MTVARRLRNRADLPQENPVQITVTTPESLDRVWAEYLRVQQHSDDAATAEEQEKATAETWQAEARQLRQQAQELAERAKRAENEAAMALNRSAQHNQERTQATQVAADLRAVVDGLAQTSNLQHPAERAARALPAGVAPVDGPLGPPLDATPAAGTSVLEGPEWNGDGS
jgi:molecular chaperone GrpE (heat shock protein)